MNKTKPLPLGDLHYSLCAGGGKQGIGADNSGMICVTQGCEVKQNGKGGASAVGRVAILGRVIREGLPQGGHLSQGQEEMREQTMHTSLGEVFQAEGSASAMVPGVFVEQEEGYAAGAE